MAHSPHIVIVGASLAGLRTAEAVLAALLRARVTIVGEEARLPYNRPPLSKEVAEMLARGGVEAATAAFSKITLNIRLTDADVTWRLGARAMEVDSATRTVQLSDGTSLIYDYLVAATGLRPRRLPHRAAPLRRHVLRTFDDALRLAPALQAGQRAIVVGGGFIGCEIAATAIKLGLAVAVVEPQNQPMLGALGPCVANAMAELHRSRGVALHTGRSVRDMRETCLGIEVELDTSETIASDFLIEAVGSHANTEWLANSRLDLSDGILCDDTLFAVGSDRILAVGDVARFPNSLFDMTPRRVEHWCIPNHTAKRAAQAIAAREHGLLLTEPFAPLPSFWTDQHGVRLQSFGAPSLAETSHIVEGDLARIGAKPCIVEYRRRDRLIGVLGLNAPPALLARYRPALERDLIAAQAA